MVVSAGDMGQRLIGRFGLGLLSAFIIGARVEFVTRSYKEGAEAIWWACDGGQEYSIGPTTKEGIGTTVTVHVPATEPEQPSPPSGLDVTQTDHVTCFATFPFGSPSAKTMMSFLRHCAMSWKSRLTFGKSCAPTPISWPIKPIKMWPLRNGN
jgi:hypothetical protein